MRASKLKSQRRARRRRGIAKRIRGTSECPRLSVFRSSNHIYAQIIDDLNCETLCAASTRGKRLRDAVKYGGNRAAARIVGKALAEDAKGRNIERVRFDRGGYRYHGRIKELADAAREAGLKF